MQYRQNHNAHIWARIAHGQMLSGATAAREASRIAEAAADAARGAFWQARRRKLVQDDIVTVASPEFLAYYADNGGFEGVGTLEEAFGAYCEDNLTLCRACNAWFPDDLMEFAHDDLMVHRDLVDDYNDDDDDDGGWDQSDRAQYGTLWGAL